MKLRLSIDTFAIGVMTVLTVIIGIVILVGESAGVQVRVDVPEDGVVGPFEAVTFTFSEKISTEIASDLISIDPIHEGYLSAVDDYSVRFIPLKPYEQDVTYTFKVSPGEINSTTREVKKPQSWQVHVREPRVAYVVSEGGQSSIWSMTPRCAWPRCKGCLIPTARAAPAALSSTPRSARGSRTTCRSLCAHWAEPPHARRRRRGADWPTTFL